MALRPRLDLPRLALAAVAALLCGCSGGSGGDEQAPAFAVELEWLVPVKARESLSAQLTFRRSDAAPPESVTGVSFQMLLPSATGDEAPPEVEPRVTPVSTAVFLVEDIYVGSPGDWLVSIGATVDGVQDGVTLPLEVP